MAVALMLMIAGCGGGGSGGGSSGGTSVAPDTDSGNSNGGTSVVPDTDSGGESVLSGTATLTWTAPKTNADGTVLTDLAGYKIYYGTISGNYTEVKDVGIPSCSTTGDNRECSYTLEDLSPGTWYFAVTAYDTSGNESDYSNEVSKKVL